MVLGFLIDVYSTQNGDPLQIRNTTLNGLLGDRALIGEWGADILLDINSDYLIYINKLH